MIARVVEAMGIVGVVRSVLAKSTKILVACTGVLLLFSLLTYHVGDPSWNRVGTEPVRNAFGLFGASIADGLLQTVGWMSAVLVAALFSWTWRLMQNDAPLRLGWRMVALLLMLVAGSTALALIAASTEASWLQHSSGAIGVVIAFKLLALIGFWGVLGISSLLFIALFPLAMGLKSDEWVAMSMVAKRVWVMLVGYVHTLIELLRRPREEVEEEETDEEIVDEDDAAEADEDGEDLSDLPPLTAPKKRIEAKKPSKAKAQPSLDLGARTGDYTMPSITMLQKPSTKGAPKQQSEAALEQNARLLESVLKDFGVIGEIIRVRPGPVVTLYEFEPAPGIKSSRVIGLADDIARSMSAISARISVIVGQNALGIELPNVHRETVYLRDLCEDESYANTQAKLPLLLGKDISGEPIIADLAKMPHVLVAGTTGSGKSVAINTMIMSLIYHLTPEQCKFIMIDPKMLELSVYDGIPHLLSPVVTEPGKAVVALKWTVKEMEQRYRLMSNLGVRNIENYNKRLEEARKNGEELTRTVQTGFDPETGKPIMEKLPMDMTPLPFIVVIVDEMADLMIVAGKDIEGSIQRLAQMARAAGIHIIMATQRPSVDVITGVIKANFPTRISFQVTSKIDSRTILGEMGAEQLLGQGDMLYMAGGGRITRVHGPFITDKEVENIVAYLRTQGEPQYDAAVTYDEEADEGGEAAFDEDESDAERELYKQAVEIVVREGKASTSYVQRRLKIGYNRAARIIDRMESEGIVGQANHVGKREVLIRE
jgi:S-DNA-T family DNA segregation ATPase FtsK/SpoIIIE